MVSVNKIYLDGGRLGAEKRGCAVTGKEKPVFSWSALSSDKNNRQTAYRLRVYDGDGAIYDSGLCKTEKQSAVYEGAPLPEGRVLAVGVTVVDAYGNESGEKLSYFSYGKTDMSGASYISAKDPVHGAVTYFIKEFEIEDVPARACLYAAGIGYHCATVNGERAGDSRLDPAHTNYERTVSYAVYPMLEGLLKKGKNTLEIAVADGWRYNDTEIFRTVFASRKVEFFGDTALICKLRLEFEDGTVREIVSDGSFSVSSGPVTDGGIFKGEVYDARVRKCDMPRTPAVTVEGPRGRLVPMTVEPIREKEIYKAKSVFESSDGVYVYDFGQNIAGVPKIKLPKGLKRGERITVRLAEMLDEDGSIYTLPLRDAKQTDVYIAAGDGSDKEYYQPEFTYHGFRYAELTGIELPEKDAVTAIALYTDIKNESSFRCGDPRLNKLHEMAVRTETSNIHSIMTDCPQRDERMGWMNDATVRFTAAPYNFDTARIYGKILNDIRSEQRADGAFTCCAPFVFGAYPADPVCSSFLVLGNESVLHYGNTELIEEYFEAFEKWEDSLLSRSDGYIVRYSYYGDWAAPAYACRSGEDAYSSVTDGLFMSTGYSYYNCTLLEKFARILNREDKAEYYASLAEGIKAAIYDRWLDKESGRFGAASMAMQSFALWLGIVPESLEQKVAFELARELKESGYRFTTGNLCTLYMIEMLTEYGYINEAYALLTKDTYPSYGFMMQNEATTVWERFELKKEEGMNSHNHPMYASVDKWFYSHLCGIRPVSPAFEEFDVCPAYPDGLLSADATVDTQKGDITVRWVNRFGEYKLYVTVPFGTEANVTLPDKTVKVGSGSHVFRFNKNSK